jgi:hypothetical protein
MVETTRRVVSTLRLVHVSKGLSQIQLVAVK